MKTAVFWTVTQCSLVGEHQGYAECLISILKMDAAHSSDTLVPSYQTISCHNAEDHIINGIVTYSSKNVRKSIRTDTDIT